MILALLAYLAFGCLTGLTVFAIESLPGYGKDRLTDHRIGVAFVIFAWPVLLALTTAALFTPSERVDR